MPSVLRRFEQAAVVAASTTWKLYRAEQPARPKIVRQALERLGGTFIKFGQVMALRPDFLPRAYCYELFHLLNRVPPFPYETGPLRRGLA